MQLDAQTLPAKLSGRRVCFKGAEAIERFGNPGRGKLRHVWRSVYPTRAALHPSSASEESSEVASAAMAYTVRNNLTPLEAPCIV